MTQRAPDRLAEALDHVDRNGGLLFLPDCSGMEADHLFRAMEREELITRHSWTGELILTESGKARAASPAAPIVGAWAR